MKDKIIRGTCYTYIILCNVLQCENSSWEKLLLSTIHHDLQDMELFSDLFFSIYFSADFTINNTTNKNYNDTIQSKLHQWPQYSNLLLWRVILHIHSYAKYILELPPHVLLVQPVCYPRLYRTPSCHLPNSITHIHRPFICRRSNTNEWFL